LFDGQQAIALDLYAHEDEEFPLTDDFSYFKIIYMSQHIPAIDMEEFDVGDKRYLVSLDDQGNVRSFVFRNAQWSRPLNIQGAIRLTTVAPNGVQGLFVIKQDGRLCRLDPDRMSCPDVSKGQWPQDVKAMTYLGQDLYHLKTDGQIIHSMTGQVFAPLQGQIVEQMTSVPTYDSFAL
ncbi:MAG: hypothetical protein KDD43_14740, partial [Bdellovibrionales bacterium]|nr:hypothetical protein [Bdellovibrionales bacterium]